MPVLYAVLTRTRVSVQLFAENVFGILQSMKAREEGSQHRQQTSMPHTPAVSTTVYEGTRERQPAPPTELHASHPRCKYNSL